LIKQQGSWFVFTAKDLVRESGLSTHAVRFRLAKLTGAGSVRLLHTKKPANEKVYTSLIDPVFALEDRKPTDHASGITSFWNNPFNLKNAIDMRWANE